MRKEHVQPNFRGQTGEIYIVDGPKDGTKRRTRIRGASGAPLTFQNGKEIRFKSYDHAARFMNNWHMHHA